MITPPSEDPLMVNRDDTRPHLAVVLQRRVRGHQVRSRMPRKLAPGVYMREIAGGRPEGLPIIYEAGHGPASWTAPTAASLQASSATRSPAHARTLTHARTHSLAHARTHAH
jgi:hypothetical protein